MTFKSLIIAGAALSMTVLGTSCQENEYGVVDLTFPEEPVEVFEPQVYKLSHPCMLHTQKDIDYTKARLGSSPWSEAYKQLKNSSFAVSTYTPSPVEYLARMDASNWGTYNDRWKNSDLKDKWYNGIHNNYTNFFRDCAAAYQNALIWTLEGDKAAAECAIRIINEWASKNKGLLLYGNGGMPDPNEYLIMIQVHQIANAAELVRNYNNWGSSNEFKNACNWLRTYFYPHCSQFLANQTGDHAWMNWDLASMTGVLSIGILCDDQDIINEAILYFKQGPGPGCILGKGVIAVYDDPSGSGEKLAQGNESGRDQGHNTLCAALVGTFCQMAYSIGEDLFSFADGRAIAFAQYVAKYNYVDPKINYSDSSTLTSSAFVYPESSVPFTSYTYGDHGSMSKISADGRGTLRPGWDIWAGYCKTHGIKGTYVTKMAERLTPDGGGGNYGPNSGGFDQLGFSTLMMHRE